MGRGIHDLSATEKRDLTDKLTMPVAPFGALVVAAVLCLTALLLTPALLRAPASGVPATHFAAR